MFSFIPPVVNINADNISPNMIKAYKVYHSTVVSCSYRSRGENRQGQTHCIFHYTVKGSGEVIYKGESYKTKEGEGFFNIVDENNSGYGYYENSKKPWEFVVICFSGSNIRELTKEFMENKVIYSINDVVNFSFLLKRLLNDPGTELSLTFFPKLISMIHNTENYSSDISKKFKMIVERDILKNPTISAIATEIGVSREHLQREYFKETGTTPAKHLNYKRFEKLCFLLTSKMSESEISDIMHFPSLSGMSIFFKKFSGITPRQYRKNGYISL